MPKNANGTPVEGEYSSYTAEQLEALEEMKDTKYALGIAQSKYVNHVLHPDGSVTKDVSGLERSVKATLKEHLSGDLTDPDVLGKAQAVARKAQEVSDHIAQKRFLFVVNNEGEPVVYFQCATKDNPDLPAHATDEDRATLEEARTRLRGVIDTARQNASRRPSKSAKE